MRTITITTIIIIDCAIEIENQDSPYYTEAVYFIGLRSFNIHFSRAPWTGNKQMWK